MKYALVDSNNKLLGWYSKDIHDTIPSGCIEVTDDQWQEALNKCANKINKDGSSEVFDYSTLDERKSKVRSTRNQILTETVDPYVMNPLRWAELTIDQQTQIKQYRLDLLNVPEQSGFPDNVTWPVKPSFI